MTLCWEKIQEYSRDYQTNAEQERIIVLEALEKTLVSNLTFAVIGTNITRQVFFALQFAKNPSLWTVHLAPAFLRCMYELNVRIMWLVADPDSRCKAFIKSSIKETEQFAGVIEKTAKNQPDRKDLPEVQTALHDWLTQQASDFPSNDGGKMADVRKMAEKLEGEALKMYRMYNSSLSPAVHSSWNFIEQINLVHTNSPLHRYVRIPRIEFSAPDVEYFLSVAYFAHEALLIGRGADIGERSAFHRLIDKLTSDEAQCKHEGVE